MTLADAFADFEDDFAPPLEEEPAPIPDLLEADRALRRVARLRRERASLEEVANAERTRIDAWLADRTAGIATAEARELERLAAYHAAVLALDAKAKTISLPNGTLKARAQQPEWTFGEEFVGWALTNLPHAVRIPVPVPQVDRAVAKQLLTRSDEKGHPVAWGLTEAGESAPGVAVEHRGPKFDVTLSEEDA